jgi:hypothetical protein
MAHPRLVTFFGGAVDELRGAYKKSEGAPNACVGSLRERGIRRAVQHSLPTIASLYEGEVIDPLGGQSGQLDGIVVHASGSALATAPDDSRIAIAEGVLAVLESKSDLSGQWPEVLRTWEKVRVLRRFDGDLKGAVIIGGMLHPSEAAIPLIVLGRNGWERPQTLCDKAIELHDSFGAPNAPSTMIVQFEPPGLGLVYWKDGRSTEKIGVIYDEQNRWRTLASIWATLTQAAQRVLVIPPRWDAYLDGP